MALARALAVEPKVLLLDEPFGALDARVRKELRVWLRRLHEETHVTTVFVTHDQEEAMEVADHIVVMDHGRIEQVGAPPRAVRAPRQRVRDELHRARSTGSATRYVRPHDIELRAEPNGDHVGGDGRARSSTSASRCGWSSRRRTARRSPPRSPARRPTASGLETGRRIFVRPTNERVFTADGAGI